MTRTIALTALAALAAQHAYAQVTYPPIGVSSDQVQAAITAATPDTCPMPRQDTLNGSAGTAARCVPREDASRPTVIQAKTGLTGTDARYTVTFDAPFASVPIYADARVYGSQQPYLCTVETVTTTTATGKCFQLVATTLPATSLALLGLVLSPFQQAGAGLSVRVVARQ